MLNSTAEMGEPKILQKFKDLLILLLYYLVKSDGVIEMNGIIKLSFDE